MALDVGAGLLFCDCRCGDIELLKLGRHFESERLGFS